MIRNTSKLATVALLGLVIGCQSKAPSEEPAAAQPPAAHTHTADMPMPTPAAPLAGEPAASAAASTLTRVTDRSLVCMVNNQFMGKPQIPIEVEGRTYFGCCEMCKGRLGNDPTTRAAADPVSGNTVDKSVAIIGQDSEGRIFYFENDQNFAAYKPKTTE